MAVIYMRHPKHGTKVATSEQEAKYDESRGWERYTPGGAEDGMRGVVAAVGEDHAPDERAELAKAWEAKFGKRPHHKKSAATLRAELAP